MSKNEPLTEQEVRTRHITPAIQQANWSAESIREEVQLTDGRVIARGNMTMRGLRKVADYVLFFKPGVPLAIVEAKDNAHGVGDGMQQALEYASMVDVPFVFSSNGEGFVFHDKTAKDGVLERELPMHAFPSPDELWRKYSAWKGLSGPGLAMVEQDYHADASTKAPRYYQANAINRVIEAIAHDQKRILLVMATGTGKTYTAFQIIWRLWKSKAKKRILFLADRNILVDQTRSNDFKPFGQAMTKITHGKVDKSFEVYLALYQAISSSDEKADLFRQFSPDFFDLIVVDECHRGSASKNSAWRDVLSYFSGATQLGLTATPKETKDVSTSNYFGEPVFTYSLKQGIEDGFLAPYKVVRIDIDKDLSGWRPEKGKRDKFGEEIEDRIYNQADFDRRLVLESRIELVAKKVTAYLKATNRFDKTIVFCEDIEHARRMRQALVNANADLCEQNHKYVMNITGDDAEGKAELDNFIDPQKLYPTIVTTSKLLTTGVDCKTCKVIVLDQTIKSMTEFKQIIGRGTRIAEDYGKLFFTILDFRKATELFADPDFDGEPVQIYVPKEGDSLAPPELANPDEVLIPDVTALGFDASDLADGAGKSGFLERREHGEKRVKYVVADVPVFVLNERVQYYGNDGKLVTTSVRDYSKDAIREQYSSLDVFLKTWSASDKKREIVQGLAERGVFFDELADEVGRDMSPFDMVCHVAFGSPPLTRKERATNVRKRNYFAKYEGAARAVLESLLDKFEQGGADDVADLHNLSHMGELNERATPMEIIALFGDKAAYQKAARELADVLYGPVNDSIRAAKLPSEGPKSA